MQVKGKNSTQLKFEAIQTDTIHSLLETYINIHSNIFEKLPPFLIDVFFYWTAIIRNLLVWSMTCETELLVHSTLSSRRTSESVCVHLYLWTHTKKTHVLASIAC